ncbi:Flp pilus assembly complex ATPase component TadA [Pseudomonas veronii]|uniref:ATPase, T2SS/T4P/T4SS family n=1 Tax=Pseudomonas veronii TaxID=76761 RepID=UPI0015A125CC|nr:ATPase, T2SS/T4P/T4SS family [Pseudomonas veronii]NWD57215.1 Flp pilus assembly complex ATPase component TadA [Pseudomonas veronii]
MGAGMDTLIVTPDKTGVVADLVSTKPLTPPQFDVPLRLNMDYFDSLLHYCLENKCEDLVLLSGDPVSVMWADAIHRLPGRELNYKEVADLLNDLVKDPNASSEVARAEPRDFNYSLRIDRTKSIRFRCVATGCMVNGGMGLEILIRPVGKIVQSMDQLGIEPYIQENCVPSAGIVIVTGPTGSGKTTLQDSMVGKILTSVPAKRVITFNSPIENDLRDIPGRVGMVVQSEIGRPGFGAHLTSYEGALRNMLRRHPHAVVIGEARDRPTIEGALLSAMSSHPTYCTTHVTSTHMTIPRMVDPFGPEDRVRMTNALVENVRLIVHQRLFPTANGLGRVAARSALAITNDMRDEAMRMPVDNLPSFLKAMTNEHGISLLKSVQNLYEAGSIAERTLHSIEQELGEGRFK